MAKCITVGAIKVFCLPGQARIHWPGCRRQWSLSYVLARPQVWTCSKRTPFAPVAYPSDWCRGQGQNRCESLWAKRRVRAGLYRTSRQPMSDSVATAAPSWTIHCKRSVSGKNISHSSHRPIRNAWRAPSIRHCSGSLGIRVPVTLDCSRGVRSPSPKACCIFPSAALRAFHGAINAFPLVVSDSSGFLSVAASRSTASRSLRWPLGMTNRALHERSTGSDGAAAGSGGPSVRGSA